MKRAFRKSDNEQTFLHQGYLGTLEYPISDPPPNNRGRRGEGIIWYKTRRPDKGFDWHYVGPQDVERVKG